MTPDTDRIFLDRAVKLAGQVDPRMTRPNPRVGCVVVQEGDIIAEGVHEVCGEAHAEVAALSQVPHTVDLSTATVYITLEPCSDKPGKKTPPCTDRLIARRPGRVVVGALDPTFGGKSLERLRQAGIDAQHVPHAPCHTVARFFLHRAQTGRAYICVKLALTLDAQLVPAQGKAITGANARQYIHLLRAEYSAILTTTRTIREDNPRLTTRLESFHRPFSHPDVLIWGTSAVPEKSHVFAPLTPPRQVERLMDMDASKLPERAVQMGYDSVLCELGGESATALLQANVVDELILLYGGVYAGGQTCPAFREDMTLDYFTLADTAQLGADAVLRFVRRD